MSVVRHALDARGVGTVTLDRPEVHNAYDGALIDALSAALAALERDPAVRVVVLRAEGKHFSAGADLGWLRRAADFTPEENLDFSRRTVAAVEALMAFPVPTVAVVQGACFGGGVGLVAAVDVAVASDDASFALTEVRVGVNPAPIVRELLAAIGARQSRRYLLTAERFDAAEARRIGLVHEVAPRAGLDEAAGRIVDALLLGGPEAQKETKALIRGVARLAPEPGAGEGLARQAAAKRASAEAKEGLQAFLDKRRPAWADGGGR